MTKVPLRHSNKYNSSLGSSKLTKQGSNAYRWFSRWCHQIVKSKKNSEVLRVLICTRLKINKKINPCTTFQSCAIYYRDLKIQGWRRQRKRCWKSEFPFFQSSSRLLQVTNFVKSRWTPLKLHPKNHSHVQKQGENFVVACVLPLYNVKLGIFTS